MTYGLARATIVCLIFVSGACSTWAETLDLSKFRVTFEDRFQSIDISAWGANTRWISHTPWHGDFGDAVFDDPRPDGPFLRGPSGGLNIIARQDGQGRWHSGLICSVDKDGDGQHGFAQKYGYFEMRAKLPDGPGVWPAFWLIGVNKVNFASEIDVIEYYGQFPEYFHNVAHVFKDGKDIFFKDNLARVQANLLTSRFNDFGVLVEPDLTRFYLNGEQIFSIPTPVEYNQPMYILADLALGGGWPIKDLRSPVVMQIERITVYQDKWRIAEGEAPQGGIVPK